MLNLERKLHNKLRVELMQNCIKEMKMERSESSENQKDNDSQMLKNVPLEKHKEQSINLETRPKRNQVINPLKHNQIVYEENELMTQFDGYWIRRENLEFMHSISRKKKKVIINQREDGNANPDLTPEEERVYRRQMKKEKRREQSLLDKQLREMANVKNK